MTKPHLLFAAGQIVLAICLAACLYLIPSYFFSSDQGGVSNYGTEPKTMWLFTAGFAAATLGTLFAGLKLSGSNGRGALRVLLLILAVLYALVLVTTFSYKLSSSLELLHQRASVVLFAGMLVTAFWSIVKVRDTRAKVAFVVFCLGLALGILNLIGTIHILFAVEILTGVAFGYLLSHTIASLENK